MTTTPELVSVLRAVEAAQCEWLYPRREDIIACYEGTLTPFGIMRQLAYGLTLGSVLEFGGGYRLSPEGRAAIEEDILS